MPTATNFGLRSFDAFSLLAAEVATDYGLWRNSEGGDVTTVLNQAQPGTADMELTGTDVATIWDSSDRLFGDAALHFDGGTSDLLASAAYSATLDLSGETTFSFYCWVRYDGPGEGPSTINGGHILEDGGQFRMRTTSADKVNVELTTSGAANRTFAKVLSAGQWYFLGFTYNSTANTARFYWGIPTDSALTVEEDLITFSGAIANEVSADITIGDRSVGGKMFEGLISECALVPGVQFSTDEMNAIFTRPWLYMTQRPIWPHGDGLRTGVLRQRTADGDMIGIQIVPSVPELMRQWDAMNDVDRAAFKTYFRDVLRGGADLFFLLDAADYDGDTEKKVRFINNPFASFPSRRKNLSEMRWELVEVG